MDNWLKIGDRVIVAAEVEGEADSLVRRMMKAARVDECESRYYAKRP